MTTSAILIVHMRNLGRVSLGFEPDGLVAFELVLPRRVVSEAASPEARRAEQQRVAELRWADQARLMEALRRTPGVTGSAAMSQVTADSGCGGTAVYLEGQPPDAPGQRICVTEVTSGFFSTLRMSLRSGRFLSESDQGREPVAVMINETAARTYWPGRNPIGALVRLSQPDNDPMEVVGVAGDARNSGVSRPAVPEVYVSAAGRAVNPMSVVLRSDLPADQVIAAVRRSIRQTEATAALNDVRTMNDAFGRTMLLERLSSLIMTFFGLAALLMATLGIYGLVSYFVRQRTVELGTRMALGAVNRDLVALVLGGGLKLSLAGVALGSIALVGGVRLLVRYLEVADYGLLPFAASTAVVAFIAAAAASVPAWRTTLISPMAAMREQPPSVWAWARQRMERAARDVREAVVGGDDSGSDISPADVLTAFVDAARGADSHTGALRAVLASVCEELHVESAALLERRDGSTPEYRCLVAAGALEAAAPVVAADGFLITRLRAYPLPLPFAPNELDALAEWAAAHRPERLDEIRALAAAGIRLAVPLRTRSEILGVLLLGNGPARLQRARETGAARVRRSVCADDRERAADRSGRRTGNAAPRHRPGLGRPAPPAARCSAARPSASISPRPAFRRAASAATTTISSSCATARSASRWPTCREKASPPP